MGEKDKAGCHVGIVAGFILFFLAIAIAVGVGIIVFFATVQNMPPCTCPKDNGGTVKDNGQGGQGGQGDGDNGYGDKGNGDKGEGNKEEMILMCEDMARNYNICLSLPPACSEDEDTSPTTTPDPDAARDIRLPKNLVPIHYDVELKPEIYGDDSEQFMFYGKVSMMFNCVEDTDEIVIHVRDLKVDDASLELKANAGQAPKIASARHLGSHDFHIIQLTSSLMAGGQYTLSMSYTGPLTGDLKGLYLTSFQKDGETSWGVGTQLQPTEAREVFPCFDEPNLKTTFNTTLVYKPSKRAFTNMPEMGAPEDRGDGWLAQRYSKTVIMPTYLIAVVIADFGTIEATSKSGVTVRIIGQEAYSDQFGLALNMSVAFLDFFEEYFDIPLPIPKLDSVALPDFGSGAMENWGLIIYREQYMINNPDTSASSTQFMAIIIAHEISHMWFGNLVTMDWWDDLWLNEGFASYISYLGIDGVYPEWNIMDEFADYETRYVMPEDSLVSSHPIYQELTHPKEIELIFDNIAYSKGGAVIRMMKEFLSDETFQAGLKRYLTKFAYKNTVHKDLWDALTEQAIEDGKSDIDVATVMDTWVLQMGYPVVTMSRHPDDDYVVKMTQNIFLQNPTATPPPSPLGDYVWHVPVTYRSSSSAESFIWLDKTEEEIGFGPDFEWYLGNIDQVGYYRVNYDRDNWLALSKQLMDDHNVFTITDRAKLINDIYTFSGAGLADITLALEMTKYVEKEKNYYPYKEVLLVVAATSIKMSESKYYGSARQYMQSITEPMFTEVGWETLDPKDLEANLLRSLVIDAACLYGVKACVDKALQEFNKYKADPANYKLDANSRRTVLEIAISMGSLEDWNWLFSQFKTATPQDATNILYALANAREPWLITRFLDMALEGEFTNQYVIHAFVYACSSQLGRKMTWDYITANYEKFTEGFKTFASYTPLVFTRALRYVNRPYDLEQAEAFLEKYQDTYSIQLAMNQAIDTIKVNIEWKEKYEAVVGEWFTQTVAPGVPE